MLRRLGGSDIFGCRWPWAVQAMGTIHCDLDLPGLTMNGLIRRITKVFSRTGSVAGGTTRLHAFSSYEEYRRSQIDTNQAKLGRVWVKREELDLLAGIIRAEIPQVRFGLCHGVRNGFEVAVFRELLGIEVLGTDISPTASQFPHVIEWDFHQIQDEWLGAVDFIYSNSLDHSYDPEHCVGQWCRCLSNPGLLFVHWSPGHNLRGEFGMNNADCFQAPRDAYQAMLSRVCDVTKTIETSAQPGRCIFVCRKRD